MSVITDSTLIGELIHQALTHKQILKQRVLQGFDFPPDIIEAMKKGLNTYEGQEKPSIDMWKECMADKVGWDISAWF